MMKVVNCDQSILEKVPNIFQKVYDHFGVKPVDLYAGVEGQDYLCFLAICGIDGLLIDKRGCREFKVDLDYRLAEYIGKEYNAFFSRSGIQTFTDKKDNEFAISFDKLDEPDDEEYTGEITFVQYHPTEDVFCQLTYPQMYREQEGVSPIYSYHTKSPNSVFIKENSSTKPRKKFGLAGKDTQNYIRYTFDRDMAGYSKILFYEHGLLRTLFNSSYVLEKDDTLRRFVKNPIVFNGVYRNVWPFVDFYKEKDIEELVKKYGFLTEIPEELINFYNGYDRSLNDINSILGQLKGKKAREEHVMKLTLVPDDK